MLLFTSADVKLEERVLAKLQEQGSTVHAYVGLEQPGDAVALYSHTDPLK